MAKKRGLGRGLDSLIPIQSVPVSVQEDTDTANGTGVEKKSSAGTSNKTSSAEKTKASGKTETKQAKKAPKPEEDTKDRVLYIRMSQIEPDRNQPRKTFDKEKLQELADSIKSKGVLQPILVQKSNGRYCIIVGERRWRAAKLAGLKEMPVIVKDLTQRERAEAALIENVQREDLNAIEEARAYQALIEEYSLTQEEVATQVSKSRTAVTNILRLLKLESSVQQMVADGILSMGHARALIPVEDPVLQKEIADKIAAENLSVRDVEKLIRSLGRTERKTPAPDTDPALEVYYKDIEQKLNEALSMKVNLQVKRSGKGKLEIAFSNADDLEKLMERLFV